MVSVSLFTTFVLMFLMLLWDPVKRVCLVNSCFYVRSGEVGREFMLFVSSSEASLSCDFMLSWLWSVCGIDMAFVSCVCGVWWLVVMKSLNCLASWTVHLYIFIYCLHNITKKILVCHTPDWLILFPSIHACFRLTHCGQWLSFHKYFYSWIVGKEQLWSHRNYFHIYSIFCC